jgi:hypothetical protein
MPNPVRGIFTNVASKVTGAEVEMTPLTAVDPDEENRWRQRFVKQVNRQLASREQTTSRPVGSHFSPASPRSPRRVTVVRRRKINKWRVIFIFLFVLSVLINIGTITWIVYWYVKLQYIRDEWNAVFKQPFTNTDPVSTPL